MKKDGLKKISQREVTQKLRKGEQYFCVACVAWQTHRDHVIRPRWRRHRHRHTFCFHLITFEGMYWFHSNFAELYITIKCRSSLIVVIIRQILAELWPFFDLGFVGVLILGFWSINFAGMHWFYWKLAEGYIIVKYRSSLISVIISKILAELWPFFELVFVDVLILVSTQ